MRYGIYNLLSGNPLGTIIGDFAPIEEQNQIIVDLEALGIDTYNFLNLSYYKGEIKFRDPIPTPYHIWDNDNEVWVPNPETLRQEKKGQVNDRRFFYDRQPITVNNITFDADAEARENINGTIARIQRGDGLPEGWMGWRAKDNQLYWGEYSAEEVLNELLDVTRAIEDRKQAILIFAWNHKYNLESMTDLQEILDYDIDEEWPQ